jgi:hypothetical protein
MTDGARSEVNSIAVDNIILRTVKITLPLPLEFFMIYARFLCLLVFMNTHASMAHEFWVEPQDYMIESSDNVIADIRNGQLFDGNSIPFIPTQYNRYDFIHGESSQKLEGDLGQRPAVNVMDVPDGLGIVVVETKPSTLSYVTWEKFQKFVDHKDLQTDKEAHLALGFPETDFKETYSRFVKSLIGIGTAQGRDRQVGLEIELVALLNPYTDDTSKGIPIQAFYQGVPSADVQIELFDKDEAGQVEITLHRTDSSGQALLPIVKGHSYLADTVLLRKAKAGSGEGVVWETLWASLTYAKE